MAGFTVSTWFVAVPTVNCGSEAGVMVSAGTGPMVNVKGKGAEEVCVASVTVAVPEIVAATRGVPEIVMVFPETAEVRVVGNPVTFAVKGATPPVTVSVPLYGTSTLPFGNVPEITGVGAGAMVNEKGKAAEERPFESITVAVPEIVPAARGVPEMVTVLPEEANVRLAGNPVMLHVKGATPPVTVKVPLYRTPAVPFGNVPEITGL